MSNKAHERLADRYASKWWKNKNDDHAHQLAVYHLSVKGWQRQNGVIMPDDRKKEYYHDAAIEGSYLLPGESLHRK